MMIPLILDHHTEKPLPKRFQKADLTRYFGKKVTKRLLWSRWNHIRHHGLPLWYHRGLIKTHRVKFRKSLGNINYSTFPQGWTRLCNMHWEGRNFKLFSAKSGFTGQIFTGNSPEWIHLGHPERLLNVLIRVVRQI